MEWVEETGRLKAHLTLGEVIQGEDVGESVRALWDRLKLLLHWEWWRASHVE